MFDRKIHCQKIASQGGKSTVLKHGKTHMQAIGRKGAETTWTKYKLVPVSLNDFAMVDRVTGKIVATINGV